MDPANAAVEGCLVDAIADAQPVDNPFCPASTKKIPLGNVAFSILNDRRPGLWGLTLPAAVLAREKTEGARAFNDWIGSRGNRRALQAAVREKLPAKAPHAK